MRGAYTGTWYGCRVMRNYLKLSNGCKTIVWFFDTADPRTYVGLLARARQAAQHLDPLQMRTGSSGSLMPGRLVMSVWHHCTPFADLPCVGFCAACAPEPRLRLVW